MFIDLKVIMPPFKGNRSTKVEGSIWVFLRDLCEIPACLTDTPYPGHSSFNTYVLIYID